MMQEAIEDAGGGDGVIVEDPWPDFESFVGVEDDGALFVNPQSKVASWAEGVLGRRSWSFGEWVRYQAGAG